MRAEAGAGSGTDVAVVGRGLVGLCCAWQLHRAGARVRLIGSDHLAAASPAAAGMLAPSVHTFGGDGSYDHFAQAARDVYPELITELEQLTGEAIPFQLNGIIEIVAPALGTGGEAAGTRGVPLAPDELAELEPLLPPGTRAVLHPRDGWVDNRILIRSLGTVLGRAAGVHLEPTSAVALRLGARAGVELADGRVLQADRVVLAAGAWSGGLRGVPRQVPVRPVRGQMLALGGVALNHVVLGTEAYAVPRPGGVAYAGSTMEETDFQCETTSDGIASIRSGLAHISPRLASAPEVERWAGLRPVTPDLQPLLGTDPEHPELVYACGHSRNGVLLAPLTGLVVTALIAGAAPPVDIGPLSPARAMPKPVR